MRKGVFDVLPDVKYNRSKFNLSHGIKTSMSVGTLYPLDIQEVLPGDSFKCRMEAVLRVTSAFLKPVIDNAFLEVYHFFVPLRLCQSDAEKIFGVASPTSYMQNIRSKACVTTSTQTVTAGSVGDYLGLPVGQVPKGISVLPFRAFAKIYNDWFRNESIIGEVAYSTSSTYSSAEYFNSRAWATDNYTGLLPHVAKKRDYFTACLPSPQRGPSVDLPLGNNAKLKHLDAPYTVSGNTVFGPKPASGWTNATHHALIVSPDASGNPLLGSETDVTGNTGSITQAPLYTNLGVDMSSVTATTVNDLRMMFALQKMLEKDARYGASYREYLRGHFGVVSPDARLQYSEYLGGGQIPINVQQVAQTSNSSPDEESTQTPQGNVAGYSWSNGYSRFSKGFVEHGYVFTVGCIRQKHTYSQGVPKLFMRSSREDFYDPLFANLGEQPVYTSEIYCTSASGLKDNVFGYNEAWAEYRYAPSRITGELRPDVSNSLAIWHYGDYYNSRPYLNASFIEEKPDFVDRALAVESTDQDQFICDLWFDLKAIRVMPAYSVPGLIDHH